MTARRTRRISSSLFPENMTPAITSIQPGRAMCPCGMRLRAWERGGGRAGKRGGRGKERPGIFRTFGGVSHIRAELTEVFGALPPEKSGFYYFPRPHAAQQG